jgi:hypothetical protein
MELASMLAGEPFSDAPRCVSPAVAGFLRVYNDYADETTRQELYAYAARAVGTKASLEVEARRVDLCLECAGRRGRRLPAWAKVWLGGAKGAGQRAAHAILVTARPGRQRAEALAFVDRLISLGSSRPPDASELAGEPPIAVRTRAARGPAAALGAHRS